MKLSDLTLPPGFSIVMDADGLELFGPDKERVAAFGPAYSVVAVEDVAWITHEERTGGPEDSPAPRQQFYVGWDGVEYPEVN